MRSDSHVRANGPCANTERTHTPGRRIAREAAPCKNLAEHRSKDMLRPLITLVGALGLLSSTAVSTQEKPTPNERSIQVKMLMPMVGCDNGQPVLNGSYTPGLGPTPLCPKTPPGGAVSYSREVPKDWAATEVGTVIVIGFSKSQVIVAADSRSGIKSSQLPFRIDDSRCKVVDIDRQLIFAAAGQTRVLPASGTVDTSQNLAGGLYYDSQEFAKHAVSTFRVDPTMSPNESVQGIAQAWAWNVAFRIRHAVEAGLYPPSPGGAAVIGLFAGREPNGDLAVAIAHVNYARPRAGLVVPVVTLSIEIPEIPEAFTWVQAFGRTDVSDTYLMRTKVTNRTRPRYLQVMSEIASDPLKFSPNVLLSLVERTAQEDTARYPDGSSVIGGPTDIARLPKSGPVEWVRKKGACKIRQRSH